MVRSARKSARPEDVRRAKWKPIIGFSQWAELVDENWHAESRICNDKWIYNNDRFWSGSWLDRSDLAVRWSERILILNSKLR